MNVLKAAAQFIAWLTTSLAGISAILYAFGYLIMRAHLHLLGVDALLAYRHEQYLQEGGKFAIVLVDLLSSLGLRILAVLGAVAVLGAIIALLAYPLLGARVRRLAATSRERYAAFKRRWPRVSQGVPAGVCLLALLMLPARELSRFRAPLEISDLLYRRDKIADAASQRIVKWVIACDEPHLQDYFATYVLPETIAAVTLLVVVLKVTAGWRSRSLLIAPFIVVSLLYVISLPMLYGVLMRPVRFPRILLRAKDEAITADRGHLYLLDKSDHEFILWSADTRRVMWVPLGVVDSAEVTETEPLLR